VPRKHLLDKHRKHRRPKATTRYIRIADTVNDGEFFMHCRWHDEAFFRRAPIVKIGTRPREAYLVWPNAAYKAVDISLRDGMHLRDVRLANAMVYRAIQDCRELYSS
jgi:hypothetical protein